MSGNKKRKEENAAASSTAALYYTILKGSTAGRESICLVVPETLADTALTALQKTKGNLHVWTCAEEKVPESTAKLLPDALAHVVPQDTPKDIGTAEDDANEDFLLDTLITGERPSFCPKILRVDIKDGKDGEHEGNPSFAAEITKKEHMDLVERLEKFFEKAPNLDGESYIFDGMWVESKSEFLESGGWKIKDKYRDIERGDLDAIMEGLMEETKDYVGENASTITDNAVDAVLSFFH